MSVLSDTAARRYLQQVGAWDPQRQAELAGTIRAAEKWAAGKCGPLEPTDVVDRLAGGTDTLSLLTTPVISLTSVTPVTADGPGTALLAGDLWPRLDVGLVQTSSGIGFTAREYDVAYVAGRTSCPDDLLQAVKAYVLYLWSPQRGTNTRGNPGKEARDQAHELIEEHELSDGFA